jgi:Spy/CpxP family protein refolding chaperone
VPSNRFFAAAILAAAVALPTAAFAQQQPTGGAQVGAPSPVPGVRHHRGSGFRGAFRGITLTAEQQQQIRNAIAQTRQANQNADPQTRRANQEKLRSTIEGILTPSQRTQFEQNLQQMRQRHREPAPAATP